MRRWPTTSKDCSTAAARRRWQRQRCASATCASAHLYRKEIEKGEAPDGAWMQAVGLSEGDAARIRDDVQSEAAAKEAKAAEEAAEAERALRLEAAIKAASENKKIETIDDPDDPPGE